MKGLIMYESYNRAELNFVGLTSWFIFVLIIYQILAFVLKLTNVWNWNWLLILIPVGVYILMHIIESIRKIYK